MNLLSYNDIISRVQILYSFKIDKLCFVQTPKVHFSCYYLFRYWVWPYLLKA